MGASGGPSEPTGPVHSDEPTGSLAAPSQSLAAGQVPLAVEASLPRRQSRRANWRAARVWRLLRVWDGEKIK